MTDIPGKLRISQLCLDEHREILALEGELDITTTFLLARTVLSTLSGRTALRVLILDLTDVSFLSAAAIRALHTIHGQLAVNGTRLRVVTGGHPQILRILALSGASLVLDCYAESDTALAAGDPAAATGELNRAWGRP